MSKMKNGEPSGCSPQDVQVRAINPDNHRELEHLSELFASPHIGAHGADLPAEYLQKLFWLSLLAPSSNEKLYTGLLGSSDAEIIAHLGIEFIPSYGTLSLHHFVTVEHVPYEVVKAAAEKMRALVAEQASRLGISTCLLFSRFSGARSGRLIEEVFAGVHVATLPAGRDDEPASGSSLSTDVYLVPLPAVETTNDQLSPLEAGALDAEHNEESEEAAAVPERRTLFPPLSHLPLIHAIYKRLPLIRDIDSSAVATSDTPARKKRGTRATYTQGHCRTGFLRHLGLHYVFLDPSARSIEEHLQLCRELASSSRLARRKCLALIPITKPGNDTLVGSLEEQGWQVVGVLPLYFGEDLIALSQQNPAILERGVGTQQPKGLRSSQALRQTPLPM